MLIFLYMGNHPVWTGVAYFVIGLFIASIAKTLYRWNVVWRDCCDRNFLGEDTHLWFVFIWLLIVPILLSILFIFNFGKIVWSIVNFLSDCWIKIMFCPKCNKKMICVTERKRLC